MLEEDACAPLFISQLYYVSVHDIKTVDYKYKRSLQKILHKQFLFPVWDPNAGKDSLQL